MHIGTEQRLGIIFEELHDMSMYMSRDGGYSRESALSSLFLFRLLFVDALLPQPKDLKSYLDSNE